MRILPAILLSVTWAFSASPWEKLSELPSWPSNALVVHNGRIFAGFGDGVHRSSDGKSWEKVLSMEPVRTLEAHGGSIYAGGDDVLQRSDDGGATWDWIRVGVKGFSATIRYGNSDFAADKGSGLLRSRDNGITWSLLDLGYDPSGMRALASTGGALFASGTWGIVRSMDFGETWAELRSGPGLFVNRLAAHRGVLYAASFQGGQVERSADEGKTWTTLGGLTPLWFVDLAAVEGFVLASTPKGIFRYSEAARSWTLLPGSEELVEAILEPAGPDLLVSSCGEIFQLRDFRTVK